MSGEYKFQECEKKKRKLGEFQECEKKQRKLGKFQECEKKRRKLGKRRGKSVREKLSIFLFLSYHQFKKKKKQ